MRFWKTQLPPRKRTQIFRFSPNDMVRDEAACFLLSNAERVSLVIIFIWLFFDWLR